MKIKLFAIAALGAFATACASTPVEDTAPVRDTRPVDPPIEDTRPIETGPMAGSPDHFVATAGDRVFYGLDRHDLSDEARATLRRQAAWLASYPGTRILVAGNCDERGMREYNLALGEKRANTVKNYLNALGVDTSRLVTRSKGENEPRCMNQTEDCWSKNRRVELIQD